ncbi:glycosyltransferase [Akkermansiaceae bacterium]|nr:glycosyltransferase [Akkermansiaceae bacterium]
MKKLEFSVLLSVYHKEIPLFLLQALESVSDQTVLPNEIVIVKDGPLTRELDTIVKRFVDFNSNLIIKVIQLQENRGLGPALNIGLQECQFDWIARMDSDDICKIDRFERIVNEIKSSGNISVIGSHIEEFHGSKECVVQKRRVELDHEDIVRDLSTRNPMNHVSVFFKKDDVLKVGGYEDWLFFEDYHLWTKMITNGMVFKNISESTVLVRIGDDMIGRRHGYQYAKLEIKFQRYLLQTKIIKEGVFAKNFILRGSVRLLPKKILNLIYRISRII